MTSTLAEANDEIEPSLVVYEDREDGWRIILDMADIMDHPHSWGVFLADVARAIGRELAGPNEMTVEEARAEVCAGFNSGAHHFRVDLFTDKGMSEEDALAEMWREMGEASGRLAEMGRALRGEATA